MLQELEISKFPDHLLYLKEEVDVGEGGSLSYWCDTVKSDWPWLQM